MTRLPIGTAWEKYWAAPEGDSERRGTTSDAGARRAGGTGVPMSLQSPAESPILHPGAATNRQMMEYAPCLTPNGLSASRSEEHTSELQSLMRISYAVFFLKKKK